VIAEVKEGIQKLSFIGVIGQNTKDKESTIFKDYYLIFFY